ncbi:hypothetical protein V7S43_011696 [Phytophthora oleae]|uniref:Uncharacterized protein n=1 Tax=Phytophthora oleae TaxID=2107226 RepID=A0ABD3F8X1_9STRA
MTPLMATTCAFFGGFSRTGGRIFQRRCNAAQFGEFEMVLILHNIAQQGLAKEIDIMDAEQSGTSLSEYYRKITRMLLTPIRSCSGWLSPSLAHCTGSHRL